MVESSAGRGTVRGARFESDEPPERGCHAAQTLKKPVPVRTSATLNGRDLSLSP